jgi:hypothetical protein
MHVTEQAVEAIVNIMKRQELDPKNVYFEIKLLPNGAVGIGFTYNREGIFREFGELKTLVSTDIDMNGVIIDCGQTGDREGILFLKEEQNVNSTN